VVGAFSAVTEFGVFGHLADGNIHVEIAGPDEDDLAVDIAVLECVARYGGSISAEHGIGRGKAELLGLSRSDAEIAAMRAIKGAWDPRGLMNPGVLFS
ncbi:MAG TPA: FAD-linked oxidase C-terminal domain-containing protein, partial [Candidatus Nanopelagicales bacterium]|nr:FAD-linked oxidase C-terminal domain-containing protein [Candidatus Nanopelagicales bacterium]